MSALSDCRSHRYAHRFDMPNWTQFQRMVKVYRSQSVTDRVTVTVTFRNIQLSSKRKVKDQTQPCPPVPYADPSYSTGVENRSPPNNSCPLCGVTPLVPPNCSLRLRGGTILGGGSICFCVSIFCTCDCTGRACSCNGRKEDFGSLPGHYVTSSDL